MSCRIAGIDVHKKVLAIVVSDVEIESEFQFDGECLAATPNSCEHWLRGCSPTRSTYRPRKDESSVPGHRDEGCFFTYFPSRSSKKTDSDD